MGHRLDHQPRPDVHPKKQRQQVFHDPNRLITLAQTRPSWAVSFQDETWWSRLTRPALHAWTDGASLRLVTQTVAKDDPDPKALAWCCDQLAATGVTTQVLVLDNAGWHVSQEVRR